MKDRTTLSLMMLCFVLLLIIVFGTTCGRRHYERKVREQVTKTIRAEMTRDSANRAAAEHQERARLALEGVSRSMARLDSAERHWRNNPTTDYEKQQGIRLTSFAAIDSVLGGSSGPWAVPQ